MVGLENLYIDENLRYPWGEVNVDEPCKYEASIPKKI